MIKLEIIELLNSVKNYDEFKKKLIQDIPDLYFKEYDELVLIANKYKINNFNLSELESECKNIIINKKTLKLVIYSNNSLYYNDESNNFILNNDINNKYDKKIYETYEGTMLSLYYYNDKWFISTRKCIDSDKSLWTSKKTFYKLFCDCLDSPFINFTNKLDKKKYYFFVLVHHENKNIIDYSQIFGDNYNKLIHIMTRDVETHEELDYDIDKSFLNIIKPKTFEDLNILNINNDKKNLKLPLTFEGIVIKLTNKETSKTIILKFHTNSYKIISKLKPNYNCRLKMFIDLYKSELLKEHIIYFPYNTNLELVDDKNNIIEYDTIGIIDGIFKILTSELFELFKLLYNLKDCSHKNKEIYDTLPNEYKIILYKIRGLYYEKKELLSKNKVSNIQINYKNYNLKIIDIYKLIKEYEINLFIKLLISRKNIFKNKFFKQISNRCDTTLLNMTNIYINNIE